MDNEMETKLFLDINRNLGEINAKMSNLCDTIAKHEQRISILEQRNVAVQLSTKDVTIQFLIKCLMASLAVIGSMTGAGAILSKIFGL